MIINPFAQKIYFETDRYGVRSLMELTFVVAKGGFMVNIQDVTTPGNPIFSLGLYRECNLKVGEKILKEFLNKFQSNSILKN